MLTERRSNSRPRGEGESEDRLLTWKEGRTGFPWTDAIMRPSSRPTLRGWRIMSSALLDEALK
ncbi:uncharacterized protein BT62DRAFT_893636 [Guyanagaster necrorhizus]|uniref:Cryptochrome/DNA photolyase FAD-binding domain-containing protein n=1 Tax=Guyanagaster necrorhizus TaxID=856835 RepID=A0A9P7VUS0_9AGAR|nr:uncharacterized protein BT62DRAFT_893636 [Guyanagaster necrorhizus MCA 3950]KAG7446835.1 hypothetical protein BT62DRAFT_893636 [Guyanagaster necrorhizus MCA 3950]